MCYVSILMCPLNQYPLKWWKKEYGQELRRHKRKMESGSTFTIALVASPNKKVSLISSVFLTLRLFVFFRILKSSLNFIKKRVS